MEVIAAAHLSNREKRSVSLPDSQLSQKLQSLKSGDR